jgi:hypothetical protein
MQKKKGVTVEKEPQRFSFKRATEAGSIDAELVFAELLNRHAPQVAPHGQGAAAWKAVQDGMLLRFPNEPSLSIGAIKSKTELMIEEHKGRHNGAIRASGIEDNVLAIDTPLGELWSKIQAMESEKKNEIAAQDAKETERESGEKLLESLAAGLQNARTRSTPAKRERVDLPPDSLDDYIKYKMKKETAEKEISIERAGIDAERAKKET